MASRQFFKKARLVVPKPKVVKPPKPDHKRKVVMGVRTTATGTLEHKAMSSRKAAQILGGQKGGLRIAALGLAHRWTSETARKAARKSWDKRRKFNKRIGRRLGDPANRRPKLWREPLRAYYAENVTKGIGYVRETKTWGRFHVVGGALTVRCISERAALIALGHLKSPRGYIPDTITPITRKSK